MKATIKQSIVQTDQIAAQLNRVKGQLDGVVSMYDDERACVDIVRQIIAVRNSLGRVARDLLTTEATRCTKEKRMEDMELVLKELFR